MPSKKVRKVVIPVAGLGTRFLPITKSIPKEMLPVLNKPTIQYIIEEAVEAGIEDVILVTSPTKKAIEDHFDRDAALEDLCLSSGKEDVCQQIKDIANLANFIYIRQKGPYGTGTPVFNARNVIGDEPFAVVYGDHIIKGASGRPHLKQLIEVYEKYGDPVLTGSIIDDEGTTKHGVVEGAEVEPGVVKVDKLMEKPGPQATKSRVGSVSGYILTPDIFDILENMKPQAGKEFYLTDAIELLMEKRPVYAKIVDAQRYDTGNMFSWLKANIEYGLMNDEIKDKLMEYLKGKVK